LAKAREARRAKSKDRPLGSTRPDLDGRKPTARQLARKTRSIAIIKRLGLPHIEHLPVVEDAAEVLPRTAEEVARRCVALAFCALKGESNDQKLVESLIKRWSAQKYFSPEERRFIKNRRPTQQDLINHAWRYEAVHVLLWALQYLKVLRPPNEICDVPTEVRTIRDEGPDGFIAHGRLRSISALLDATDLYYRLHWAAVELRLKGKVSQAVNEEIVAERHRALNWLVRYMNQEWDDVTTDT